MTYLKARVSRGVAATLVGLATLAVGTGQASAADSTRPQRSADGVTSLLQPLEQLLGGLTTGSPSPSTGTGSAALSGTPATGPTSTTGPGGAPIAATQPSSVAPGVPFSGSAADLQSFDSLVPQDTSELGSLPVLGPLLSNLLASPSQTAVLDGLIASHQMSVQWGPITTEQLPAFVALPATLARQVKAHRMSVRAAVRLAQLRASSNQGGHARTAQATGGGEPPINCKPSISHATGRVIEIHHFGFKVPLYSAYAVGRINCVFLLSPVPRGGNPPADIQAAGGSFITSPELPTPKSRYSEGVGYDGANSSFVTPARFIYGTKHRVFRFFWFAYENIVPDPYVWSASGFGGGPGIKEEQCHIASADNTDMDCHEISHEFAYNGR